MRKFVYSFSFAKFERMQLESMRCVCIRQGRSVVLSTVMLNMQRLFSLAVLTLQILFCYS